MNGIQLDTDLYLSDTFFKTEYKSCVHECIPLFFGCFALRETISISRAGGPEFYYWCHLHSFGWKLKYNFKKRDEQNLTFKALRWPSMGQEEANYHSILQGSSHLLSEMAVKRPRCQAENTLPSSFTFCLCSSCSCAGSIKYTSEPFTRLQPDRMHTEVFSLISVALDQAWGLCLCLFWTAMPSGFG